MVRLGEANPVIWDTITELMEESLKDREFSASDIEIDWKRHADARKLEREILAKYGYFKDIILHPKFQQTKQWVSDTIDWLMTNVFRTELVLGDPVMPTATAVIILYMLHKRVTYFVLALIGSFLFNVNPLYVVIISIGYYWTTSNKKPKQYKQVAPLIAKVARASKTYGEPTKFAEVDKSGPLQYDHIIIGSDISALYTAALLSKVGHSCLVLQPQGSIPLEVNSAGSPCPVPIHNLTVGKVHRYKALLDIVGGANDKIHFTPLGSESTDFAHTLLHIAHGTALGLAPRQRLTGVATFRAGEGSTVDSLAAGVSGLERKAAKTMIDALSSSLDGLTSLMLAKATKFGRDAEYDNIIKSNPAAQNLATLAQTSIDNLLTANQNPSLLALLNGLSVVGSDEALMPTEASAFGLAHFVSISEQGLYYPIGGARSLQQILISAIQRSGGAVYCDVPIKEIIVEDEAGAVGVQTLGPENLTFDANKTVVSSTGVLNTLTKLIPHEHVSTKMRAELSSLVEARPKVHVLFWLNGEAAALGLHNVQVVEVSADCPSVARLNAQVAANLPQLTSAGITGSGSASGSGKGYTSHYCKITVPSVLDPEWSSRFKGGLHCIDIEFELPEPIITLESFQYSKPPKVTSTTAADTVTTGGPKMFVATNSNTTLVKEDGSVGSAVRISKSATDKLKAFAQERLVEAYPLAASKIIHIAVVDGIVGGFRVSSTTSKFANKLGCHTDIPGLFLAGNDVATSGLMGEIQSGLIAANCILGYTPQDLINGSGLFNDLTHLQH